MEILQETPFSAYEIIKYKLFDIFVTYIVSYNCIK